MANYSNLINSIKAVIKQNGTNDITGQLMQDVLVTMTNTIGRFAAFAGTAMPSTNPNNPDQTVYYLTSIPGTYVNFGGIVVPPDRLVALHNISGAWEMVVVVTFSDGGTISIDPALDPDSVNPVENRAVYAECQAIRTLISNIPSPLRIVRRMLTAAEANAITGSTFADKYIMAFNVLATGVYTLNYFNAVQIGTALNMVKLRTGASSYADSEIVTLSGTQTMQDLVGVNHLIEDFGNWVVYAEEV